LAHSVNAIADTYEDCEELLAKLNSDCQSFFDGTIFKVTEYL